MKKPVEQADKTDTEKKDKPEKGGEEEEGEEKEEGEELVNEEEDNEEEEEQSEEDKEKSDEESPTHVPKRGMFYQHDDRNYQEDDNKRGGGRGPRVDNTGRAWGGKKEKKWVHDMFDEEEQKPKEEVVTVCACFQFPTCSRFIIITYSC